MNTKAIIKTEKLFFRKKKENGIYYYDKSKNTLFETILEKNDFIYIHNGLKIIKATNIKTDKLEGFNSNNNFISEKQLNPNITAEHAKMCGLEIKTKNNKNYIVERKHVEDQTTKDSLLLIEGIYDSKFNLLTFDYEALEYESLIDISKKFFIELDTLTELNPTYNPAVEFLFKNTDGIKISKIKIPYLNKTFYVKKINKQSKDIKQTIHTFIMLNGFNQELFGDLYFQDIKDIHQFKKLKTYNNEELNKMWLEVCSSISNKDAKYKKYMNGDIVKSNILYNKNFLMDNISVDDNYKTKNKKIKKIKIATKSNIEALKNEKSILNFISNNEMWFIDEIISLLNISEQTIKKVLRKNKIENRTRVNTKATRVNDIYNWFMMQGLKPSLEAIYETSKQNIQTPTTIDGVTTYIYKEEFISKNTIRKYIEHDLFSNKEYKKSLEENQKHLEENSPEIVDRTYKFMDDDDDLDLDFWCDETMNEQWKLEEMMEKPGYEPNKEFEDFMGELLYKNRREEYKVIIKEVEEQIRKEIEMKRTPIDLGEREKEFIIKMGWRIEDVYSRITKENSEKTLKELEEEESFSEIPKFQKKTKVEEGIDSLFEEDN